MGHKDLCIYGNESLSVILYQIKYSKRFCWEPPGHYLSVPEPGRPGCVIAIEIGVKSVIATSAGRRLARKRSFPLYISHLRFFFLQIVIDNIYSKTRWTKIGII